MGVFKHFSSSSADRQDDGPMIGRNWLSNSKNDKQAVQYESLPNPRPDNYKILNNIQIDRYLIVKIKYLDCTNYEGVKILVYEGWQIKNLLAQKLIDPHFSENSNFISPIARFEPTDRGWSMAIKFATEMSKVF